MRKALLFALSLSLLGSSGCGKTTLLRIIAGLEFADSGSVSIGDREVSAVPPKDRDIAMVFQNYALYPHLRVKENIEMGLAFVAGFLGAPPMNIFPLKRAGGVVDAGSGDGDRLCGKEEVYFRIPPDHLHFFDSTSGRRV